MTDFNNFIIIGRLTQDVDPNNRNYGTTKGGTVCATLSIANNRSRKNGDKWEDEVSFYNVSLWGRQAINLKQYLKKGTQIAVSGHLHQDRWTDEKTQERKSRISLVADNVQLLGSRNDNNQQQPQNNGYNLDFEPEY